MRFFTVVDLEGMLKLSKSHLYSLIESSNLRCHRFTRGRSGGIRVSQAQLDEYLAATEDAGTHAAPAARPAPAVTPSRPKKEKEFAFLPPKG